MPLSLPSMVDTAIEAARDDARRMAELLDYAYRYGEGEPAHALACTREVARLAALFVSKAVAADVTLKNGIWGANNLRDIAPADECPI